VLTVPAKDKDKQRAYAQKHYAANRQNVIARAAAYSKISRVAIKELIIEHKSKPCTDCGVQYPFYVMQFDHVRGKKKFNLSRVSSLGMGRQAVLDEIAKCDVVCANCHAVRTWTRLT